jgi:catechol 2,3-dioxygenase-like lactoylglutathione lyase family enzyme
MGLHQLRSITIGLPAPEGVVDYYREFGLTAGAEGQFATADGGRQLCFTEAPTRRLMAMEVGVDDADDLGRIESGLTAAGFHGERDGDRLVATEPVTGVEAVLQVAPRQSSPPALAAARNGPGHTERLGARAPGVLRSGPVTPRRLGHVVVTTTDFPATARFFSEGLGFKTSDYIADVGVFLRCSTDHHNLLLLSAPAVYLHHTAWLVDDVDEVGRGAFAMLADHPERHVWGLGRHHAGSNFFWYLRDPAGNFTEYYADLDQIPDDAEWTAESHPGHLGLYNWGPPPPASFLEPDDLASLMAATRTAAPA